MTCCSIQDCTCWELKASEEKSLHWQPRAANCIEGPRDSTDGSGDSSLGNVPGPVHLLPRPCHAPASMAGSRIPQHVLPINIGEKGGDGRPCSEQWDEGSPTRLGNPSPHTHTALQPHSGEDNKRRPNTNGQLKGQVWNCSYSSWGRSSFVPLCHSK